jgi:hypothetical protein
MYTGPHIIKDGLVFGYDTGYGIADNDTATRFYPGKPTVNYVPDADTMANWSSYSSGNDGTFITEFGTTGYRISNRASWNGLYRTITVPSAGYYTFSAWFKYLGGTSANNGATVYVNNYSGSSGDDTSTSLDKSKVGEWQRIEKTVNIQDSDLNAYFYIISFGGSSGTDRSSWEVTMPQVEPASGRTPFVDGTRSSTASLIDLKETADIDVSNVSFDSTGQPTFDGSDDRITMPAGSYETIGTNNFTIEAVCKNTKTSSYNHFFSVKDQYHFAFKASNTGTGILYVYRSSSLSTSSTVSSYIPSRSEYYHIVCKREGDNLEIFVNGVSKGTKSGWNNISIDNNSWPSYIGWGNGSEYTGGDIPIVKVYNKALTATEIKQNYNAYKNRFSI